MTADEVDLHGHTKCLGSCKDYTSPHDITSWCVQKWEEAGAVIIGKLNMHELGLGKPITDWTNCFRPKIRALL